MKKRRKASRPSVKKAARKKTRRVRRALNVKRTVRKASRRIRRGVRRSRIVPVRAAGPTSSGYSLVPGQAFSTPATTRIQPPPLPQFDPTPAVRALFGTPAAPEAPRPGALSIQSSPPALSPHVLQLVPTRPAYELRGAPRGTVSVLPRIGESWRLRAGDEPNFVARVGKPAGAAAEFLLMLPVACIEGYLASVEACAWALGAAARLPVELARRATPWRDLVEEIGPQAEVLAGILSIPKSIGAPRRRTRTFSFSLPEGWPRAIAPFVIIALTITASLHAFGAVAAIRAGKASIIGSGRTAGEHVKQAAVAAVSADLVSAEREFAESRDAFLYAQKELERLPAVAKELARVLPRSRRTLEAGETLISSGAALADAAASLSSEIRTLGEETNIIYKITVVRNAADAALPHVAAASAALRSLDARTIPPGERETFAALRDGAAGAETALRDLVPLAEAVMRLLGRDGPRRYLVIFQNSNELRPTGGFIGSFAELTVRRGAVERLVVPPGGSYDIQGQLTALVLPPEPLRLLTGRWFFHDANWFPDFPTTAAKLQWFYEKSGGPTTDGVIAVTSALLPELLRLVGPVTAPDGRVFTADNVLDAIQTEAESAQARAGGKPKALISELAPTVMERLAALPADRFLPAVEVLSDALRSKRLQIFVKDQDIQRIIRDRGWDGGIPGVDGDFLALVTANIGGEKTDAVIEEAVEHEASIASDGTITDTLVIRRTHAGIRGAPHTGARNYSYLRVYVPKGSVLLDASGDFGGPAPEEFEGADPVYEQDRSIAAIEIEKGVEPRSGTRVTEEFGKTVYGAWMKLDPGETRVIRYTYRLPFRVSLPQPPQDIRETLRQVFHGPEAASHRLTVWHQPGAERRTVSTAIRLPAGYRIAWQTPRDRPLDATTLTAETRDMFVGAVITRR